MKNLLLFIIISGLLFITGHEVIAKGKKMDTLTEKQKNIVMISSYTATGDLGNLENVIQKGLQEGMTINEAKEVLVQMYAYCGFPRSINGLTTLLKVTKNGNYKEGEAGKPLPQNADKNKIGEKVQTELVGQAVKGELFEFAPFILKMIVK